MFYKTVICKILPDIFAIASAISYNTSFFYEEESITTYAKSLRCADSEWQKHMSLPYIFITNVTGEPSPCHTAKQRVVYCTDVSLTFENNMVEWRYQEVKKDG